MPGVIKFHLEDEALGALEQSRGEMPREAWLRVAVDEKLAREGVAVVGLQLSEDTLARIEQSRGEISTQAWILDAIGARLGGTPGHLADIRVPARRPTNTVVTEGGMATQPKHHPRCTCGVCQPKATKRA